MHSKPGKATKKASKRSKITKTNKVVQFFKARFGSIKALDETGGEVLQKGYFLYSVGKGVYFFCHAVDPGLGLNMLGDYVVVPAIRKMGYDRTANVVQGGFKAGSFLISPFVVAGKEVLSFVTHWGANKVNEKHSSKTLAAVCHILAEVASIHGAQAAHSLAPKPTISIAGTTNSGATRVPVVVSPHPPIAPTGKVRVPALDLSVFSSLTAPEFKKLTKAEFKALSGVKTQTDELTEVDKEILKAQYERQMNNKLNPGLNPFTQLYNYLTGTPQPEMPPKVEIPAGPEYSLPYPNEPVDYMDQICQINSNGTTKSCAVKYASGEYDSSDRQYCKSTEGSLNQHLYGDFTPSDVLYNIEQSYDEPHCGEHY